MDYVDQTAVVHTGTYNINKKVAEEFGNRNCCYKPGRTASPSGGVALRRGKKGQVMLAPRWFPRVGLHFFSLF